MAYHSVMRRLLFALMIALLPLHGWIGDAMATEMAVAQLQHPQLATKITAVHAHEMDTGAHFFHEGAAPEAVLEQPLLQEGQVAHDCAGQSSDNPFHAANAYCESCAACQVCHMVALSPVVADLNHFISACTLPHAAAAAFTSAEAALGQKPPIS
jgi:hypothetical protein